MNAVKKFAQKIASVEAIGRHQELGIRLLLLLAVVGFISLGLLLWGEFLLIPEEVVRAVTLVVSTARVVFAHSVSFR